MREYRAAKYTEESFLTAECTPRVIFVYAIAGAPNAAHSSFDGP